MASLLLVASINVPRVPQNAERLQGESKYLSEDPIEISNSLASHWDVASRTSNVSVLVWYILDKVITPYLSLGGSYTFGATPADVADLYWITRSQSKRHESMIGAQVDFLSRTYEEWPLENPSGLGSMGLDSAASSFSGLKSDSLPMAAQSTFNLELSWLLLVERGYLCKFRLGSFWLDAVRTIACASSERPARACPNSDMA